MNAGTSAAAPEALRDRLVDAAQECFLRYGVAKTTVEDVARAAGVSRPTVYRQFGGGRDEIILEVMIRRGAEHYARIGRVVERRPNCADALVAGIIEAIRASRTDEYMSMLIVPDVVGRTALVAAASATVREATRGLLEPLCDRARAEGLLREGLDLDEAAEWLVRVVASFVAADGPVQRSDRRLAAYLHRFLVPAFLYDEPRG